MKMTNWITRTHQAWKFNLFVMMIGVSGALFLLLVWQVNDPIRFAKWGIISPVIFPLAFAGVGLLAFLWFVLAIKCPNCGKRPTWNILSHSSSSNWLNSLLQLNACPCCGDKGATKD
jgi:hypothetical protein